MPKVVPGYKEAAKTRIMEAALDSFLRKGFDASTMDEVAKRVGVSKAAIYRYFRSKDALLEELIRGGQRQLRRLLGEAFEGRTLEGGLDILIASIDQMYGKWNDLIFEWFAQACRDVRLRKLLKEDGEKDIETVTEFLVKLRKKGVLRTRTDPRVLAQIMETAFIGAWIRLAMGHDRADVASSLQNLASLLEHRR